MNLTRLLALLLLLAGCQTTPKDNRGQLHGMYKLLIIENLDSAGVWQEEKWAKDGTGYIIYDGLGHMAVEITPKDYSQFKWINEEATINVDTLRAKVDSMSTPDIKNAVVEFASNYVYMGNYTINDSAGTVTHHLLSGTVPSIWGTDKERKFSFSGDTITLKVKNVNRRLKWIRQQ